MILGNSNGNNRGKKYIIKGKDDLTYEQTNKEKADRFRDWFGLNYDAIVLQMKQKEMLDEDILTDTFLKMYDNILFGGNEIKDYKSYFFRAFFTNTIQYSIKAGRTNALPTGYDQPNGEGYDFETEEKQKQLEQDIFAYVYDKYPLREFEIFKMYMLLKPAINYDRLASITELKSYQIQFIVSKIKKDLSTHADFCRRRKEMG